MEFLMTYGWAILAVVITIAALAYFGVIYISSFAPAICIIFPGVACTDIEVTNVEIRLTLENGIGRNFEDFSINVPGCAQSTLENGLSDGEKETIVMICNNILPDKSRFKPDIDIYYKQGGLIHTRKGALTARVESGLIKNGGFEIEDPTYSEPNSVPIDYWYGYFDDPVFCATTPGTCSGVSFTRTTSDTHTGRYALRNQPPAGGNAYNYYYNDIPVLIDANKKYRVCLYYKSLSDPSNNPVSLHIGYYDAIGNQLPDGWVPPLTIGTPTTSWTSLCETFGDAAHPHPTGAAKILLYFFFQNAGNPAYITLIDDISLSVIG